MSHTTKITHKILLTTVHVGGCKVRPSTTVGMSVNTFPLVNEGKINVSSSDVFYTDNTTQQ